MSGKLRRLFLFVARAPILAVIIAVAAGIGWVVGRFVLSPNGSSESQQVAVAYTSNSLVSVADNGVNCSPTFVESQTGDVNISCESN